MKIPHFKYCSKAPYNKHQARIELEGVEIHEIDNPDDFHQALGYTPEMAKSGILPDEYVWERYVKGSETRCSICYQLHMFQYLMKHSEIFRTRYEADKAEWIAAYAMAGIVTNKIVCPVCKTKSSKKKTHNFKQAN